MERSIHYNTHIVIVEIMTISYLKFGIHMRKSLLTYYLPRNGWKIRWIKLLSCHSKIKLSYFQLFLLYSNATYMPQ